MVHVMSGMKRYSDGLIQRWCWASDPCMCLVLCQVWCMHEEEVRKAVDRVLTADDIMHQQLFGYDRMRHHPIRTVGKDTTDESSPWGTGRALD